MADSYVTHTGNGAAGPFSFNALDYLSVDHLVVKVDGTAKTLTTHYTISGTDVTFTSGNFPAADAVIKIQRNTPRTKADRVVDFADGAVLTEADLDNAHLQNLYIAQEAFETSGAVLAYDDTLGAYTANDGTADREIKNLADPSTDGSAVNRKWVSDIASFGVPGVPQQFNTTLDGSTTFVSLTGWTGISQNMIIVSLDGVIQIPGTDFKIDSSGSNTRLTFIGSSAPANGTILNVQNFGVAKSSSTLANDSVTTASIKDAAVATAKIADTAVTSGKIAADAITEAKIADDAVDFDRLKDTQFVKSSEVPGGNTDHALIVDRSNGNLSHRDIVTADINDFENVLTNRAVSGFGPAQGSVVMGDGTTNYKITNLSDGTALTDAVNLQQLNGTAGIGITATVTGTLTYQDIYHNTSSNTPRSVDTTTTTLPADCDRPLQVFVDVDLTSITESLTDSEDCELWIDVSAYNSSDAVVGEAQAWKIATVTNGSIDVSTYTKMTAYPMYAPSTATYVKSKVYTANSAGGPDNPDRFTVTGTVKLQVSFSRVA